MSASARLRCDRASSDETFGYEPGFLGCEAADTLLHALRDGLPWRQEPILLFGKARLQPRLTAWMSDPGIRYRYSGLQLDPQPWHPGVDRLREWLQEQLGHPFNSVLANLYRDGRDSMGWHSDDERELGARPLIASISLGAGRRFLVRSRAGGRSRAWWLQHGDLLVMRGDAQSVFRHSLPRTARPVGLRINLTFRNVLQA